MRTIHLTRNLVALVDDADYEWLNQWRWSVMGSGRCLYAHRSVGGGSEQWILMHRQIMGVDGPRVDHRNGNGLDNQRHNLRHSTHAQNIQNSGLNSRNISGFRGVAWEAGRKKWFVSIQVDGRSRYIGRFETPQAAAIAWNKVALETWGDFARLNTI